MPLDDVLDHFDWEKKQKAEQELDAWLEKAFTPEVETVCIRRFPFSWQAELAKVILREHQIPSFVTNSLTSNMMHLEWSQVDLYVRAEDALQASQVLEENENAAEEEVPE